MTTLALIAALANNDVIGVDNRLPWHLPADLRHFKQLTLGKPIIMGRKTFDSIGRPLPGRSNIVISRNPDWRAEGVWLCAGLDAALALADQIAKSDGADEILIIGGAEIYRQALPLATRLYLSRVDCEIEGDAHFPNFDATQWLHTLLESLPATDDSPACRFWQLDRLPDKATA